MGPSLLMALCSVLMATFQMVRTDVICSGVTLPSSEVDSLQGSLEGKIHLPGSPEYEAGKVMKNTKYNSAFCMVVMVKSAEDVSKVLQFCEKHNIRPTVKSGGHDYIGRSSGDSSLSINLGKMTAITYPRDDRAVVEAGNTWDMVYQALHVKNKLVVGGSARTVGVGGYTLGGGHSPMSRSFGLAVDNTVGFVLVTPDGSIISFTEEGTTLKKNGVVQTNYTDPELFWAVRGGGGGTYGVVTSYTYRIHEAPVDGFCQIVTAFILRSDIYGNLGKRVFDPWNQLLLKGIPNNWGGYVIANSARINEIPTTKGSVTFALLHRGGCDTDTFRHVNDSMAAISPTTRVYYSVKQYATFWDYAKTVNDPIFFRVYLINRLLQPADLSGQLSSVMSGLADVESTILCTWTLLGGQVSQTPALSSSVTPKFRTSVGSWTCAKGWQEERDDWDAIYAMRQYGLKMYTVGDGVYFNEPDYYLDNWKIEYWGSMETYNRLLKVKNKYDPRRRFRCHNCVGDGV